MQAPATKVLNDGHRVLARDDGFALPCRTWTEAQRRAAALKAQGVKALIHKNPQYRMFYVELPD